MSKPNKGQIFLSDNYVVLDVETTNLEKGHPRNKNNRLLMVSYSLGPTHPKYAQFLRSTRKSAQGISEYNRTLGIYSKTLIGNEYEVSRKLLELIDSAEFIVGHNAKFELGWLFRCGLSPYRALAFCTQVAAYVHKSNRKGSVSLAALLQAEQLGSKETLVSKLIKGGLCPSEIPLSLLAEYNRIDVEQTHALFLKQRRNYITLFPVISTRCYALPMLAQLELTGLQLTEDILKLSSSVSEEYRNISEEFMKLTGGINFNSPKQVRSYLYETLKFTEPIDPKTGEGYKTDSGEKSTDKNVIALLRTETPEQEEFKRLKLRLGLLESDNRVLTKYVDCWNNNKGILHFNFNNTVVATGRLSSSGAIYKQNGQNIARKLKPLFGPRNENYLIGEIDYPNHEWRCAGHFGRDKQLLTDVLSGFDPHKFSAGVFNIDRQSAKAETFRPLFGSNGITPRQRKYAKDFRERWGGVDKVQKEWATHCVRTGYVSTETGWKFYWPAKLTNWGGISYKTEIYDYPIQYFAGGELTMMACLFLWYLMEGKKSFMINTVHDSDIWEVAPDEQEEWKEHSINSFTTLVYEYMLAQYGIQLYIPLGADIKIGPRWSKGVEEKIDVLFSGERLKLRK